MLAVTHPLQLCNESRALVYVSANNYTALQNYRTSRISGFFSRLTRVCNGIYCGEKVYEYASTAFRPCSIGAFSPWHAGQGTNRLTFSPTEQDYTTEGTGCYCWDRYAWSRCVYHTKKCESLTRGFIHLRFNREFRIRGRRWEDWRVDSVRIIMLG